ncbi:MAG TPA: tyrosine--tRNA ligase [Acidimicrobiales bacterium]|nr:tyrosine--tRNA ligase [Acidimicrobiales bacterium]
MSDVWEDLQWRGLVHQVTDHALGKLLDEDFLTAYCGIDPTGPSMHPGHLIGVLTLRRLQLAGHQIVPLIGSATGMIGDPSFRSEERQLLSEGDIEVNVQGIRTQVAALLEIDSDSKLPAIVADNGRWLRQLALTDFLRDVGKHFSVNEMIRKDSVRTRLEAREQGISYTEFTYMLLQAYDYLHLFDEHNCRLQIGGSDQWGNITEGIDLIRRLRGETAYGLTWPLLTYDDGSKMGKTDARTQVWLAPNLTSPYRFFQYWVRTEDADVGMRLRWFTFLPRERIEELDQATVDSPERREAQRVLAWEVTAMVHGPAEADRAQRAAEVLFTEAVAELDEATLLDVFADAPSTELGRDGLDALSLVDALMSSGLVKSKGDARKLITQNGASINNRRVDDVERLLTRDDLLHDRYVVLRKGKRDHHLLSFR